MILQPEQLKMRFGGHETFPMRSTWLFKSYNLVKKQEQYDRSVFSDDIGIREMGVGRNMVKSIEHWSGASIIITKTSNKTYGTTTFGDLLLGKYDPYLENPSSIWMVHYLLCTSNQAGLWNVIFGRIQDQFISLQIINSVLPDVTNIKNCKVPAQTTLIKDLECVRQSYLEPISKGKKRYKEIDCPFRELRILDRAGDDELIIQRSHRQSLSPWVFLATLKRFWRIQHPTSSSILLKNCLYDVDSPGMVFRLSEDAILKLLDQSCTILKSTLNVSLTSGSRQVIWSDRNEHSEVELWIKSYHE